MSTELKVEARISLTIGEQKIELTMEEAKALLAKLQSAVGAPVIPRQPKTVDRDIPFPWDRFPKPQEDPYYRPRRDTWRDNPMICGGDQNIRTLAQANTLGIK